MVGELQRGVNGDARHVAGNAISLFEAVGVGRSAGVAGDALCNIERMVIADGILVGRMASGASEFPAGETGAHHQAVGLESYIFYIAFLTGQNGGAMAITAEQGLRFRVHLAWVKRPAVTLRMAFSAGVTARAAYARVNGFEVLGITARGVASETALHWLGT